MPRLCLQGTVTDIYSFHLSDVWIFQSNLKDAVVPYPHLPLLGLALRIHISGKKKKNHTGFVVSLWQMSNFKVHGKL